MKHVAISPTTTLLLRARELIARGWCQGPCAINGEGQEVNIFHEEAVAFCSYGAIVRAGIEVQAEPYEAMAELSPIIRRYGYADIISFNEAPGRTQEEVLHLFDSVIGASYA